MCVIADGGWNTRMRRGTRPGPSRAMWELPTPGSGRTALAERWAPRKRLCGVMGPVVPGGHYAGGNDATNTVTVLGTVLPVLRT
jgi:hypothetical protein